MPRARRRTRKRSSRSGVTRWYALTPHAMLHPGDNSWDSQLMEIQDSRGTVIDWRSLGQVTILRLIVDYTMHPTYPDLVIPPADYWSTVHLGIFATIEEAPDANRWDPNEPSAPFIWRQSWNERVSVRAFNANSTQVAWVVSDGGTVRVDTVQKRRMTEDFRLWTSSAFFSAVDETPMAIGYTGRVLLFVP